MLVHHLGNLNPHSIPFRFLEAYDEGTYTANKFQKNIFTRQVVCPVTLYNRQQGATEGGEHMSVSERRQRLLEVLCLRRHDTCANLAHEFHVCQRTIRYDIESLMSSYPIETVCGRYGGGVRVADWFHLDRKTLSPKQSSLLMKLREQLQGDDLDTLNSILVQFAP